MKSHGKCGQIFVLRAILIIVFQRDLFREFVFCLKYDCPKKFSGKIKTSGVVTPVDFIANYIPYYYGDSLMLTKTAQGAIVACIQSLGQDSEFDGETLRTAVGNFNYDGKVFHYFGSESIIAAPADIARFVSAISMVLSEKNYSDKEYEAVHPGELQRVKKMLIQKDVSSIIESRLLSIKKSLELNATDYLIKGESWNTNNINKNNMIISESFAREVLGKYGINPEDFLQQGHWEILEAELQKMEKDIPVGMVFTEQSPVKVQTKK